MRPLRAGLLAALAWSVGGVLAQGPYPYQPPQIPYVDPEQEQAELQYSQLKLEYDRLQKAGLQLDPAVSLEARVENLRRQEQLLDRIIEFAISLKTSEEGQYQAERRVVIDERRKLEAEWRGRQEVERRKQQALQQARQALLRVPPDLLGAQQALAAALKIDPRNPEALRLLAFVTRELGDRWLLRIIGWTISGIVALAAVGLAWWVWRSRARGGELEMLEGPQPGERVRLDRDVVILGAGNDADWTIPDPARRISRRHCEIARSGRRYFLTDTSTNGTRINDEFISPGEAILLRRGDRIALTDDVVIRFR